MGQNVIYGRPFGLWNTRFQAVPHTHVWQTLKTPPSIIFVFTFTFRVGRHWEQRRRKQLHPMGIRYLLRNTHPSSTRVTHIRKITLISRIYLCRNHCKLLPHGALCLNDFYFSLNISFNKGQFWINARKIALVWAKMT